MMEVFTGRDEAKYPSIFRQMYRQRYDIYVRRRKWRGLNPENGLERDEYDRHDSVYLLALDEDDGVLAGLRLLPTEGAHIFGDLFPQLASAQPVPRGPDIIELTRFYVAPFGANRKLRSWLIGVISAGMFEYCLENGIRQVSSVIDTFLLPQMLELEWRVKPLGLPFRYGEGIAVGVIIDVTEEVLSSTKRLRGIDGPVLRSDGVHVPRIPASIRESGLAVSGYAH